MNCLQAEMACLELTEDWKDGRWLGYQDFAA